MPQLPYRFVEVNGLRMRIADQGQGPLVLLCHGFPETAYSWRHQIAALAAANYRVVAPDLRGFGGTEGPADVGQYSILHLVADMVGLLDALGEEKAVIVGNDWGATLAWQAALLRPDRFHAVAAFGVPMMGQPPVPPTRIFPQTDDALFYTLYFQQPDLAEAEFERDVGLTLRKILSAASGDAGARREGDGTPNPFAMVSRDRGLLAPLPTPDALPSWLSEADLDAYVGDFQASGFRGGLNLYRNLDRNWEMQHAFSGLKVAVPALYLVGERDVGLQIPGMRDIIAAMPALVPQLRQPIYLEGCGHWPSQERPVLVSDALLSFLRAL
ncbi:epoxide hydrolase [Aminobacter sp. DSM 101952]|nr:epoxide hydrolase [Aminobacter sp. DSM 101952]